MKYDTWIEVWDFYFNIIDSAGLRSERLSVMRVCAGTYEKKEATII